MTDHPKKALVTAPLLRRESMGEHYHVLTFDLPGGLPAGAGQFMMLRGAGWSDAPLLPRPMSYLSGGTTPSVLIKVIGEGTALMARAQTGEPFTILGPLGNRWRPPSTERPLLVAGGVGIAPLLFFARELHAAGKRPIALYGGRTARDLPLDDELHEVAELHVTTEDGSRGHKGRVTDVLRELLGAPGVEVYTCGPDRMMAAVSELCEERDVPCEASLETPMACGYGVCLGCPVPTTDSGYIYACTQGPCVDARRIAWGASGHAPAHRPSAPAADATRKGGTP